MLRHDDNLEPSVPPEELLREVEARQHENHLRTPLPASNRLGVGIGFFAALVLLAGMVAFLRAPVHSPPVAVAASAGPRAAPIGIPDNLLVRRPDHKMALLSEVPDNQPVLCTLAGTEDSAHLADFAPGLYHWTLIKHGGKAYMRGWIGDMSDTALRSTVVQVHPTSDGVTEAMKPVRVTLPLGSFQSPPGLTNVNVISAAHMVPDEHLKERW